MSEKPNKVLSGAGASAPNKMRLYATWVDRTPANCIPRLCSLTLTRLVILKPLGSELSSLCIALKMQSSKRTLRSHELILPQNGLLDAPLDVTFCLQYPHFLKREGNKLHILLQRRKRYKNRTMLGFKTLAEGIIRMDQVLQKQMDLELELVSDSGSKDKGQGAVAKLYVFQLSSTPVDQEQKGDRDHDFSDDEDDISSGEQEVDDLSDIEPIRTKLPHARHNLKQRFVSLLRRFKVPDTEGGRGGDLSNPSDIQALFQELESLSCDEDSGDQDTMSISSTPKPSLRPFFSSSKSLLDSSHTMLIDSDTKLGIEEKTCSGSDGNADICYTDPEAQSDPQTGSPPKQDQASTPRVKSSENEFTNLMAELSERKSKLFRSSASSAKKKNSLSVNTDIQNIETVTARKVFIDSISKTLPLEENVLPESIVLVAASDHLANQISAALGSQHKIFQPVSAIETKMVLNAVISKIHKYCNSCAKPATPVKLVTVGSDTLMGWIVRPLIELLSAKAPEWQQYLRLYVVPLGMCTIAKQLAAIDQGYATLFPIEQDAKGEELIKRLVRYVGSASAVTQLPVGEAMLTCHDENSQLFIPFINEVRVGPSDSPLTTSVDLEDCLSCSSPPGPSLTPPSSPNVQARESPWEPVELQVDYWPVRYGSDKAKPDGKTSLKGLFRGLQATPTAAAGLSVNVHVTTKEKKQKIMRLGKKKEKEKDPEPRSQNIEGVSRLICSVRSSHNTPMKVYIDGVEFGGVKFFQLNSTWQTHIKNVSIAIMGVPLASIELH